jgi:hypothetical protein
MQTIAGLTERAILLQAGHVAAIGPSPDVVERYLGAQSASAAIYEHRPSGLHPEITRVELRLSGPGNVQQFGKPMIVEIEIATPTPVPNANVSFQIMTSDSQPIVHVLNLDSEMPILRSAGTQTLHCRFPNLRLFPGHYHLAFHLGASEPRRVFNAPDQICRFEVAVLDEIRDFYWAPNTALYVENVVWTCERGGCNHSPSPQEGSAATEPEPSTT